MILKRPKFMDLEYFVPEPFHWHLLPDAPKEIQEEFDRFMRNLSKKPI